MPTPAPEAPTIKLGQRELVAERPSSLTVCTEVVAFGARNQPRAFGAALGVCIPRVPRMLKIADLAGHGYDVGRFGGAVLDCLVATGDVSLEDALAAGARCYAWLAANQIGEQEVVEATDFFGRTEAASSTP